jgi:hypothetical protein
VPPLFRSMIPFKLIRVRLGHGRLQDQPRIFTDFLRDLRSERSRQEREKKLTCSACNENAELESKHVVPWIFGLSLFTCGSCKHHFCRRASCVVGLTDCSSGCGEASCQGCAKVVRCTKCHESSCETAKSFL